VVLSESELGSPRETLNLVVREGLRQLGLDDPEIEEG
jgi:hypothetical protein